MAPNLDQWLGQVAIVTGASAGCGASIAELLVKEGLKVVGLARRKEKIEQLSHQLSKLNPKGTLYAFQADMTVESDIRAAFEWTEKNVGPVAVLINNAGISQPTSLIGGDASMWRKILDTNVLGLSIATREAIDQMTKHKIDGQVIHINSILGHYVAHVPNLNMYSASKFAVTALTETLRQELIAKGSKVRITSVSPGPVDTEFATANKLFSTKNAQFEELYKSMPKLTGEDVANAVYYVLSNPPHVQVQEVMLRPLGEPV